MVLKISRSKIFWFLDKLKGSKLINHLNDVSHIIDNNEFSVSERRRNNIIKDILNHATTTTPYYKKFKELQKIESFPVINKIIIRENFEAFRSEPYLKDSFFKASTSGSTGKPFILYQDIDKKLRNTADNLFFYSKANILLGEKLYVLEVWENKYQMNTRIESIKRNMVQINVSIFNDSEIKAFIKSLEKDSSIKNIIGIASIFERICRYLDKTESSPLPHTKIKSAIAISESLNEYTKIAMKKYFNVNIVSRYSSEELGIIAQQYPNKSKSGFNINWASYHVEILKMDSDNPAENGEMGRIVITDLFNYCMPIIRYDTGDISSFDMIPSQSNPFPGLKTI